jgi:GNAT superfamily N-acetyltransferase
VTRALSVRQAQPGDLNVVVELRLALLREYRDHALYRHLRADATARAFELYATQLGSPHEAVFLAQRDRRVVGILRCVDTPGSPLMLPERYCYVSSAYVRPEERSRGVLRALLEAAEKWCALRGLGEMRLHNAAAAEIAAAAWDALGFDVVELVRRRVLEGREGGAGGGRRSQKSKRERAEAF